MNWFQIKQGLALLLVLLLVLSGCGNSDADASPAQDPVDTEEPSVSQSEQPEETPPSSESGPAADTAEPSPSEPEESEEPTVEPSPAVEPTAPAVLNAPEVEGIMAEGESVDVEWFADAVFVGDSRTDGLRLYSGIKGTTFISYKGLSVFNIGSKECIETEEGKVTVLTALGQQQWAKVYLMLGVNELGYASGSFRDSYTKLVQQIKEIQPNAAIYLQTILPVNETIARSKGISSAITNERVILFNSVISEIAESEGVALVDVAANFWTAEGNMAADNTSDGVHLTRQGYVSWYEYLKSHTGTTEPLGEPASAIFVPSESPAAQPEDPQPEESEEPPETPSDESGEPEGSGESGEPGAGSGDGQPETPVPAGNENADEGEGNG